MFLCGQETLNYWKQLTHVLKYFRAEEDPSARLPKNFIQGFIEVWTQSVSNSNASERLANDECRGETRCAQEAGACKYCTYHSHTKEPKIQKDMTLHKSRNH